MIVGASRAWSARPSHRLKSQEGGRRAALLGLEGESALELEVLRRRRGAAELSLEPGGRLVAEFEVAPAEDRPPQRWRVVLDVRGAPGGLPRERLLGALRRWLREVRKDPGATAEVDGVKLRLHPVTAYPLEG